MGSCKDTLRGVFVINLIDRHLFGYFYDKIAILALIGDILNS
jgi:hypothetical protein